MKSNNSPPSLSQISVGESSDGKARDYSRVHSAVVCNPQLHSILALAFVFYQTPSPLQISHLLDISWENVLQTLLFRHPPLGSPPQFLSDPTCPATFVDSSRWHAFVAVWCLTRSSINYDARDIFYASDFWAKHTCNARPSQDIWDALRRSPIPCRLGSHAMLPCVIKWLERVDSEDTRELAITYRSTYRQTAAELATGMRVKSWVA
ncbi:hypothetical protein B0H13DRAFT_2101123 [Mycena leptocephala]|nr:hypothetical protein B0H13DRAFT_2101123 [Mycena leptocephala]